MSHATGGSLRFRVKFGRGHETLANAPTGILAVSQQEVRLAEGGRDVFQQRRSAIADTRLSIPSQGGGGSTAGVRVDFADRTAYVPLPTSQNPKDEVQLMMTYLVTSTTPRPAVRR